MDRKTQNTGKRQQMGAPFRLFNMEQSRAVPLPGSGLIRAIAEEQDSGTCSTAVCRGRVLALPDKRL